MRIDLNADLGEGFGTSRRVEDLALLDLVSSANIACGYHAGDEITMRDTVRAAHDRGVAIGAHPSYPDIQGFGRRELGLEPAEIYLHVRAQIRALADVCDSHKARLSYVKPHGALYNRAAKDAAVAGAIVTAVRDFDRSLTLLGLPQSAMESAARDANLSFAREAFADRAYERDGTLVPRSEPGAIIRDTTIAVDRALRLVREGMVETIDHESIHLRPDSLCVHGDNPDAQVLIAALRARLESEGVTIAAFTR